MPCSSHDFDWNTDTISRLRWLWAEGHSTAEIGRRMGISKNAVVGKSHRLDLPTRPSPIRRDGVRKPQAPPRPRCPTLPELQSRTVEPKAPAIATAVAVTLREVLPEVVPPMPVAVAIRGTKPCCWPIGEPGTRLFRFCNAPTRAANRIAQTIAASPTAKRNRGKKQPETDLNRGTGDHYGTRVRLLRCKTG